MKYLSYILILCLIAGKYLSYLEIEYSLIFLSFEPIVFIGALLLWLIHLFFSAVNDFRYLVLVCLTFSSFSVLFSPFGLNRSYEEGLQIDVINYNIKALKFYEEFNALNKEYVDLQDLPETLFLVNWIKSKPSDVLCLQEFLLCADRSIKTPFLDSLLNVYPYSVFNKDSIHIKHDLVRPIIFSRYKVVDSGVLEGGVGLNECVFADLEIEDKVLRVYNAHFYSNFVTMNDFDDYGASLVGKVLKSSKGRRKQLNYLLNHINKCPYPFIVCGDFNALTSSLVYKKISSVAQDAHLFSGNGYGSTFFHDKLPHLRIDYQFFSNELMLISQEIMCKVKYSDHYPVKGSYFLKRSAD